MGRVDDTAIINWGDGCLEQTKSLGPASLISLFYLLVFVLAVVRLGQT